MRNLAVRDEATDIPTKADVDLKVSADGTYASATDDVLKSDVTGDSVDRFVINADGRLEWSPGNAAIDAKFFRVAAGSLDIAATPGNGPGGLRVVLQAAGTVASAYLTAMNDGSRVTQLQTLSSTYTTSGLLVAHQSVLYASGETLLIAQAAAKDIIFATGGVGTANERLRINHSTGNVEVKTDLTVADEAYDATAWDGSLEVPTKNAIRDTLTTTALGVVNHGSTAGTARPSGYAAIQWIGSVEPTNAINGDLWVDTS